MSNVTNLILILAPGESDEVIATINSFKYQDGNRQLNLVNITTKNNNPLNYGGDKYFEATVLMGTFNHFSYHDFIAFLKTIPFNDKGLVQVLVKGNNHDRFEIFYPFELYDE